MAMSREKLNRSVMVGAGVMTVAVLALTGYAAFFGDDDSSEPSSSAGGKPSASASPSPGYSAPEDWTEPQKWAALPRGQRTDAHDNPVGFPQTTEGAVAMLAASNSTAVEGSRSIVDEQLANYQSYISAADKSSQNAEKVELAASETDKQLHQQLGVAAGRPLPSGAYVRNHIVGFKVIKESKGEVSAWLLARATTKAGETQKEQGSYTRTLVAARWEAGDWKLSAAATQIALEQAKGQPKPEMAAPGDATFNSSGWTAIREAS